MHPPTCLALTSHCPHSLVLLSMPCQPLSAAGVGVLASGWMPVSEPFLCWSISRVSRLAEL